MPRTNVIPMAQKREIAGEILRNAEAHNQLFLEYVTESLRRLQDTESKCVERLNEFVPTNRPLTVAEAASFLGMTKRALNDGTRPGKNPVVPFLIMNGKKLFRLSSLEKELERREIKRAEVRL